MRITFDDQYLVTVSEDASLFIHKISDKEGRGKRDRDVPYAEEVLITRSDLEEKVTAYFHLLRGHLYIQHLPVELLFATTSYLLQVCVIFMLSRKINK